MEILLLAEYYWSGTLDVTNNRPALEAAS